MILVDVDIFIVYLLKVVLDLLFFMVDGCYIDLWGGIKKIL